MYQKLFEKEYLDAFQVFIYIIDRIKRRIPTSIIRLGDGEGAVLGYPEIIGREDVDFSLQIWLRTTNISEKRIRSLTDALRCSVANADILGLPRKKQVDNSHRYRAVLEAISRFELLNDRTLLTHAALHRLLQHALLYRPIIENRDFLGIISCRSLQCTLAREFNVEHVQWYGVRGELTDVGVVDTLHFPDGFDEIRENLVVPYSGALFLIGAGCFGKIYCQWVKEQGGIALDIGSIFDAWANVGRSEIVEDPVLGFDVYRQYGSMRKADAIERYNFINAKLGLDVTSARVGSDYFPHLPEEW